MLRTGGITVDYQGSATAAVADQVQVINTAVASGHGRHLHLHR